MKKFFVLIVSMLASGTGFADTIQYQELVPWTTIVGSLGKTQNYGHAIEGDTAYFSLNVSNGAIVRVDGIGSTPTARTLVTTSDWQAASGGVNNLTPFFGFGLSGDYLQFGESSSDAIYRVDKSTGGIATYVSKNTIKSYTGATDVALGSGQGIKTATGEHYFFEGTSKQVLRTDGTGQVVSVIASSDLQSLLGTASPSVTGGFDFDSAGNLYFGANGGLYKWNEATHIGSSLFSATQITAIAGGSLFGDLFTAPDGEIYFTAGTNGTTKSILSFDPSTADPTLSLLISSTDLGNSPLKSSNIYALGSYNGHLTLNASGGTSVNKGLFTVVPEPSGLLLLGVGGLSLLAFRKMIGRRGLA